VIRSGFIGGIAAVGVGAMQARATPVRIGYLGNVCEAATYAAPAADAFAREGLEASIVRFASEAALVDALAGGRVDAASMRLASLLAPLARGSRIRVLAGLHSGCLRVVSPDPVAARFTDLRGKTVAIDYLRSPSMNMLSALLGVRGIDPREVSWRVFGSDALAQQLIAKNVSCVAAADPLGYLLLTSQLAAPYLDTADGGFTCGTDFAHGHHCFLTMHAGLVEKRGTTAAAITRAFLATSRAMPKRIGVEAVRDAQAGYADDDVSQTIGMLSSYRWNASAEFVAEEIEFTARDFVGVGLLPKGTNPHDLAGRAYANVLNV